MNACFFLNKRGNQIQPRFSCCGILKCEIEDMEIA